MTSYDDVIVVHACVHRSLPSMEVSHGRVTGTPKSQLRDRGEGGGEVRGEREEERGGGGQRWKGKGREARGRGGKREGRGGEWEAGAGNIEWCEKELKV